MPRSVRRSASRGNAVAGPLADDRVSELERKLRRSRGTVGALSAFVAASGVAITAMVWYWRSYLLGPSESVFARGPYLLSVTSTEARLRWNVRSGEAMELGALGQDGREIRADGERISGLAPDSQYAWVARVGGVAAAGGTLRTPPTELSRPMRFAVLADYGSGNDHEWAVGRVLAAHHPEFVVSAGDNSYFVAAGVLLDRNIFKPLGELMRHAPLYIGLGDHDRYPPGPSAISSAFDVPDGGFHVVHHGPLQLVVLGERSDAEGMELAVRAIREPGPALRFVVSHAPLRPGDPLLPELRDAGVAAVFSGHLHRYERRTVDDVVTFTVGTGGQGPGDLRHTARSPDAIVSLLDLGALIVDVATDRSVTFTFVDDGGRVLDRATSA